MIALFAGDNVDANIMTLDGKGTFHGMGLIRAVTPRNQSSRSQTMPRKPVGLLDITEDTKIPVHQYHAANRLRSSLQFEKVCLDEIPIIDRKIDILWEMSFRYKSVSPNWSGMMHMIHANMQHPGKFSVYLLPMIDLQSSDKTCIYSTLRYICGIAHTNKIPAIVTFDQPLYWKSREIVAEASDDDSVKDVIVRMGTFHMLMNLLGAIGDLMDGTGIRKLFETLYGDNAVLHIMSGKAIQRSFRAHLLLDKCIAHETISEIITENLDFEEQLNSLDAKYDSVISGKLQISDLKNDETLVEIEKTVEDKKCAKSIVSRTANIWYLYQKLIQTARNLVKSDRSSSWNSHLRVIYDCLPIFAAAGHFNYLKSTYLYLMDMLALKHTCPGVNKMFENGLFVIRRTDKFWAGLSLDLVIEQVLMRALKTRGGLTRGSGMTERQRAIWTMSAPACAEYNLAMQDFTDTKYFTSDQHREGTKARVERDLGDFQKLLDVFHSCEPLSAEPGLRNIATGMEASDMINVDHWEEVGRGIVEKMIGQPIFTYSFTRKDKVKNMASSCAVRIADDRTIDPA
ncbi:hypothetical protein SNE40_008368 [Patella caerulea]|uniref:Uncharacterized protein n=1 Tax=Patella caerulea TaxID=87958 RepID=A0AAN8JZK5_PATCE